ncbi:MAG: hypothetical protein KDD99_30360 [Bacteroidetes bacterium]|nr:hypothetical protein [Bacteroidota bacterium]
MAKANLQLIQALRKTAENLDQGSNYQWGHMGACNCGNLAQELTGLSKAEIHTYALQSRHGDWAEQAMEYCPDSGYPLDYVIDLLLESGLTLSDLKHLERLSDANILRNLPEGKKYLQKNSRKDVVLYLRTWADLLEKELQSTPIEKVTATAQVLVS